MDITILIVILALFGVVLAYAHLWMEKRISDRVRLKISVVKRRQTAINNELIKRLAAVENGIVIKDEENSRDPLLKSANPFERNEARHVATIRKDVVSVNGTPQRKG